MSMTFLIIALLVLVIVAGASYGVFLLLNPSRTAGDRLRELNEDEGDGFELGGEDLDGLGGFASRLGQLGSPQDEAERNKLRLVLLQAGYKHRHALEILNGVKVTLAMCLPLLMLAFAANMTLMKGAALIMVSATAGYYLPSMYVTNLQQKRQKDLLRSFPDALDLLVSSVEAGLGIDAAFRRVAAEIEQAAPDLAKEFQLVNHEISAGVPRVTALTHLHERTGLDEVRSLVNMLAQAERFGTSVAKSLRVHAQGTRDKRMSRAEEEAAQVSPKLTVIMILFLLPVLMSILVGPAMINVKNTFSGGG